MNFTQLYRLRRKKLRKYLKILLLRLKAVKKVERLLSEVQSSIQDLLVSVFQSSLHEHVRFVSRCTKL